MGRMEELQAEMVELRKAEDAEAERKQSLKNEAWKDLPYEWKVTTRALVIGSTWCHVKHLFPSYPKGATVEVAHVQRRKANQEQFIARYGLPPMHAEKWDGMTYLRTEEGILYHDGGGTYVLYDPFFITEEEWDSLKKGNIPERFKRP